MYGRGTEKSTVLALPPEKSEDEQVGSDEDNDIDVCSGWREG